MNRSTPATGLLPVLKQPGLTSHDVVARARRLLGLRRVGHTGTLDPGAAGLLLLLVGRGTRLAELLQAEDKTYVAELCLGAETDTQDAYGEARRVQPDCVVEKTRLLDIMARFVGPLDQTPPMTSAVRQGGRRLYELARKGVEVHRPTRRVVVHSLDVLHIEPASGKPATGRGDVPSAPGELGFGTKITFQVSCSKGTYVRTLCHDIGQALGCGAFMSFLLRTRIGDLDVSTARTLDELEEEAAHGGIDLLPLDAALQHVPSAALPEIAARRVLQGQAVEIGQSDVCAVSKPPFSGRPGADMLRLHDQQGTLLALARKIPNRPGRWQPRIVFGDERGNAVE